MMKENKLLMVKIIHTIIWLFFNVVIFYVLYAVIINKIDKWVWICVGLVFLEGLVLIIFKMFCPLTLIARNYSNSQKDNFDIFLPNWLAKHNKLFFTSIYIVGLLIVALRVIQNL